MLKRILRGAGFLTTAIVASSAGAQTIWPFQTPSCSADTVGQACPNGTCIPAFAYEGSSYPVHVFVCVPLPGPYCPAEDLDEACEDGSLCTFYGTGFEEAECAGSTSNAFLVVPEMGCGAAPTSVASGGGSSSSSGGGDLPGGSGSSSGIGEGGIGSSGGTGCSPGWYPGNGGCVSCATSSGCGPDLWDINCLSRGGNGGSGSSGGTGGSGGNASSSSASSSGYIYISNPCGSGSYPDNDGGCLSCTTSSGCGGEYGWGASGGGGGSSSGSDGTGASSSGSTGGNGSNAGSSSGSSSGPFANACGYPDNDEGCLGWGTSSGGGGASSSGTSGGSSGIGSSGGFLSNACGSGWYPDNDGGCLSCATSSGCGGNVDTWGNSSGGGSTGNGGGTSGSSTGSSSGGVGGQGATGFSSDAGHADVSSLPPSSTGDGGSTGAADNGGGEAVSGCACSLSLGRPGSSRPGVLALVGLGAMLWRRRRSL
jgi:hypothetical protein